MRITGQILGGDATINGLKSKLDRIPSAIEKAVYREAINLVSYIKSEKLTDKVLRVRTGRLRRSITARFENQGKDTFTAYVGTNVKYAKAHELGFVGAVDIRAHTRTIKSAFGNALATPTTIDVRGHSRQMNIPARPFLQPSFEENLPRITANLRKALIEAIR